METYVIVNLKSKTGRAAKAWTLVRSELHKRGISYRAYRTKETGYAARLTRYLCEKHPEEKRILVLGGDGTLNEVVNGIADFSTVLLGYIPTGSSNDFARSIGIEKNPLVALAQCLDDDSYRELDVGVVTAKGTQRRYIGSAGLGYDAYICYGVSISPMKEKLNQLGLGKLAYLYIGMRQLLAYPLCSMETQVDGGPWKTWNNVFFASPMNQPYEGGGFKMSPSAVMDDGLLSVLLVHNIPKWEVFLILPTAYFGKHTWFPGVETFSCKTITLRASVPLVLHVDGETVRDVQEASFAIEEEKLRLLIG